VRYKKKKKDCRKFTSSKDKEFIIKLYKKKEEDEEKLYF
jgi:hypothetical protein